MNRDSFSQEDIFFMQRAFQLAALGLGSVAPNPLVGCVVVHEGKIIGEGWHQKYGQVHAEVNAINSVENQHVLAQSTLYVTLEPCSHFGKTPPCADLICKHNFKKVVLANTDPNPLVAGRGIQKLKNAGIEVVTGVLESFGRTFNAKFFTFIEKKRPYILLKWAETLDGFLARTDYSSKWISNDISRQYVHKWRSEEQAILVGKNTAFYDNPKLNVRDWAGKNPVRIVIDPNLRLSKNLYLFDGSQTTICYNNSLNEENEYAEFVRIPFETKNILEDQYRWLEILLEDLYQRNIQSVLVEGGKTILEAFLNANIWDEARVFTSTQRFYNGISAPKIASNYLTQNIDLQGDRLGFYKNSF